MEKSSKRGKIPQHDWPSIIARYEAGETLASIARTYDCSPPAISYIVSRSRARSSAGEPAAAQPAPPAEPQLVKAPPTPTRAGDMAAAALAHGPDPANHPGASSATPADSHEIPRPAEPARLGERGLFGDGLPAAGPGASPLREPERPVPRFAQAPREFHPSGNGANPVRPAAPAPVFRQEGEVRRTLHLQLGSGNGGGAIGEGPARPMGVSQSGDHPDGRPPGGPPPAPARFGPAPRPPEAPPAALGAMARPPGAMQVAAVGSDEPARAKDGGAFIDRALRQRIDDDIAAFLAAFDAALDHDTVETRSGLREATDRLLRAGARTRIELERLEARVPLSSRERHAPPPFARPR